MNAVTESKSQGETDSSNTGDSQHLTTEPIPKDQRQSYRYPAQKGQEAAMVRRRGKTQSARLVEESASGFAIDVTSHLRVELGEMFDVCLYSGWYRARIIHIEAGVEESRIGFERVSVLVGPDGQPNPNDAAGLNSRSWLARNAMTLVVVVAIVVLMFSGTTSFFNGKSANSTNGANHDFNRGPGDERLLYMLDTVSMLAKPEAAAELELTRQQQENLLRIFDGVSNSLAKLYRDTENAPPEVWFGESQNIVNQAVEEVLCSLTDKQIILWRKMLLRRRQAAG